MPISDAVRRWWPLPVSLDLVRAPVKAAAAAVLEEVTRFAAGDQLATDWVAFASLNDVFGCVAEFDNVPTVFYVLPTCSDWSVMWNNSFLCDGYDALCWCLTTNHALTTMHWRSSNEDAVFQAGSSFTFRSMSESGLRERCVYCCKNDARWEFHAVGEPLPEEDLQAYSARRTRDRLQESGILKLLEGLGARPWRDEFYAPGAAFRIERVVRSGTIIQKRFCDFACERAEYHG